MAFLIPENIPSRSDIPERLQKVARALRDHASEDMTAWLESFDDESHLLVLDPATGVILIGLPELAGRGISQRFRFRQRSAEEQQALSGAIQSRLVELSSKLGKEVRLEGVPIVACHAMPGHDRAAVAAIEDLPEHVLTMDDLSEPGAPRKAFARMLGGEAALPLTDVQERVARGLLKPEVIISGAADNGSGQLVFRPPEVAADEVIRVLDRKQERLARYLGPGYRVIRGVAGSGKTLVLTYRAKYLAEFFPNLRVLIVCFNKVLSVALAKEVADFSSVDVRTVDSLAYSIAKPPRAKKPDYSAIRTKATSLLGSVRNSEKYDVVLVDEAQDLDRSGLDIAHGLLKPGRDDFIMALDSAQNIYRRKVGWNPPGVTARGRTSILRINYRNTREILDFAFRFLTRGSPPEAGWNVDLDPEAIVPPEAASRSGPSPKLLSCSDGASEVRQIAREVSQLLDSGIDPRSIAVLYGSKPVQNRLYYAFRDAELPYFNVSWGKNRAKAVEVADVRASTVQGLKGLEFSRVFMCGVDEVWQPEDGDEDSVRRLLYVGMTRAMDELTITVSGDGPMARELVRM